MRQGNIIGKRLRLVRELRRWTQQRFAQKLRDAGHDVSRDIVARWEICKTADTDLWLIGIATVLRVSVLDLFPPGGRGRPRIFRPARFFP